MKYYIIVLSLLVAGCSQVTPLPQSDPTTLRPMNPTKWDSTQAMDDMRKELGVVQ